jgi:predicted nucleic acid-binding protein
LTKRFLLEEGNATAARLFNAASVLHSVTYLGYAETAGVLLRKVNGRQITRREFLDGRSELRASVLLSPRFDLVTVDNADILAGMALTVRHNINTSDAAILAAYLRLTTAPRHGTLLIVSDHRLERAARNEGLATLDPARTNPEALTALGVL